jgi:hypothetical protein
MYRVLRANGVMFVTLPDKRYTFDHERPVTPLRHLLDDHQNGPSGSEHAHLEEWFRLVVGLREDEASSRAAEHATLAGVEGNIHYHVWTQREMLELAAALQGILKLEVELVRRAGIEVIFVFRKQQAPQSDGRVDYT